MTKKLLLIAAGLGIGLLVIVPLILLVMVSLWDAPGDVLTPAGLPRNTSYYIDMPDGTRIAADLWVPKDLAPGQRIPTVIEATRYWRDTGLTLPGRVAAMLGTPLPGVDPGTHSAFFSNGGYAMLTLDVRGTGASSGIHVTEYAPQEAADYPHIIEWVTQQPWSSGDVFAMGISYAGTAAELMTTARHPALKAVAPLYADFDAQMQLATPRGVYQPAFIETWSEAVSAMDRNDLCGVLRASGQTADCFVPGLLIAGVKPVQDEADYLQEAVAAHASPNVAQMVQHLTYRDSTWGTSEVLPRDNSPFGLKHIIEQSNVPMFVVTGWFDAATTNGALARFATFNNPQEVWVGAFSHGGGFDTDPYKAPDAPSAWTAQEQLEKVLAFFEQHRTDRIVPADKQPAALKTLNYYVNGADEFLQTSTWPPGHLGARTYYLTAQNTLQNDLPEHRQFDRYALDFATATATTSRWMTQMGGGDVIYDRRAEMASRSLTYTSPAFSQDTELTGSVELNLWMTNSHPEGALHAYLEDVAPDGTVRYLTEGVLNLEHRANTDTPAYPEFGPTHSFLEKDAKPLPTGRVFSIATTLFATSVLIQKDHKIRLSLTGADAASFAQLPAGADAVTRHIYYGPTTPSSIVVHTAPWR